MKYLLVGLFLAVPLATAQPKRTALLPACQLALDVNFYHPREIRDKVEGFQLGWCLGNVSAIYASESPRLCEDHKVEIEEAVEVVVDFLKQHPDLQHKDSADIVRWALTERYACDKGDSDRQGN